MLTLTNAPIPCTPHPNDTETTCKNEEACWGRSYWWLLSLFFPKEFRVFIVPSTTQFFIERCKN
jgi:hypothetical protein